ncbi:MAG: hypothetical protein HUU34_16625 [Saprospiraceae bacterium]|jgi:predicted nucleic acid-binding protein|nr:hypothetical protein [Saprospiraceae bacterium]
MKIVVDSNIVFSALLNPRSNIGDIILNSKGLRIDLYSCEQLRTEIGKYDQKIISSANYNMHEYHELQYLVYKQITFFTESIIPFEIWMQAAGWVRDIDMDDISFIALSLYLDIKLWTGDKVLYNGLTKKGFDKLTTTQEIIQSLHGNK